MAAIRAGLLTSYGADLTIPAWLYITVRSLYDPRRTTLLRRLFGRTPELAFFAVTAGSIGTELSQYFAPHGPFPGTFDPVDILMYLLGTGICYYAEKRTSHTSE